VWTQEMPCAPETSALALSLEEVAGAARGTAPAVPVVARGDDGATGSGAEAPVCVRTGEEDSPDDWRKLAMPAETLAVCSIMR